MHACLQQLAYIYTFAMLLYYPKALYGVPFVSKLQNKEQTQNHMELLINVLGDLIKGTPQLCVKILHQFCLFPRL